MSGMMYVVTIGRGVRIRVRPVFKEIVIYDGEWMTVVLTDTSEQEYFPASPCPDIGIARRKTALPG